MIRELKKKRRLISLSLVFCMLLQSIGMPVGYGLTGGPTQPEVQSFQPVGANDMVNLFTGDFNYNIPLVELPGPSGGYPFNLSYQAGIGLDQEASWVGLGWNLQPGAIMRQMRGLPDEFNGDEVITTTSVAKNVTVGLGAGVNVELFGAANIPMGFSVYQNSYKGLGYSIDASLGFEKTIKGMTGSMGLGLSLDSEEGLNVNPSLSLAGKVGQFGLGAGYNSRQGLQHVSASMRIPTVVNVRSTLGLAHPGYTPQITLPMNNLNVSATLKVGASFWGVFGSPYLRGFYSEQTLVNDGMPVNTKAYGYLNYQNASEKDLLDFNREKDGMISKETPNLPIPSLTYDIYSVTGQGVAGTFRPFRNDYGSMYDQETSSSSNAIGLGVDVGPAMSHVGGNLTVSHSKSTTGVWSERNDLLTKHYFVNENPSPGAAMFEPWVYKIHGEASSSSTSKFSAIGGEKPVKPTLSASNENPYIRSSLETQNPKSTIAVSANNAGTNERLSRSTAISSVTNEQLLNGQTEVLSYFKIKYKDAVGTELAFSRTDAKKLKHYAGHIITNTEGVRYIYGLPAYNISQEEVVFSTGSSSSARVDIDIDANNALKFDKTGTDKYYKSTTIPPYAHSFLLTSILGPDYVDVGEDGVDSEDLGYWVKFTYQRTSSETNAYSWRDPYTKAHFQEGWKSDPRDNKGSFVFGQKEVWYLSRAETKSHYIDFVIAAREDGRGAESRLQNISPATTRNGNTLYFLQEIRLYAKGKDVNNASISTLVKSVALEYDYGLCGNVENYKGTSSTAKGKLTLKSVKFKGGTSTRGEMAPYKFTYNNEPSSSPILYQNANESSGSLWGYLYDRWGNYKPYPGRGTAQGQPLHNLDFPYVEQDPLSKSSIDANAAAWSLKEITLPSGGKIIVDYESDDYAYVQNKPAMQMMQIVDPYSSLSALNNEFDLQYTSTSHPKIRFKLERPLSKNATASDIDKEIRRYFDSQTGQLYFKLFINIRKKSDGIAEYITGYADVVGMGLERLNATSDYEYGYFELKAESAGFKDGNNNPVLVHPFAKRAWLHLRINQPELANPGAPLSPTSNDKERIGQIRSLASIGPQIRSMFNSFNKMCYNNNWGKNVIANKSWIRLNSPDRIKYGGGIRVKQLTMVDNWQEESSTDSESVYGQYFEYLTKDSDGTVISSGVASYEPVYGGDENAMRYAKKYTESVPLRSDNNLFFEYPINESYYPAAQVGYSCVTVMSLASAARAKKAISNNIFPAGQIFGSTGKTVNEFYTAKDFPVITDETDKTNAQYKLNLQIPILGSITISKLTTTQGYSIMTNDMHGKPKKVSNYRQVSSATASIDGSFEEDPISYVQYNYLTKESIVGKQKVNVLQNLMKDNSDGTVSPATSSELADQGTPKSYLYQETEFFHDLRQFEDQTWEGGAQLNTDIVYIPVFFAPVPIPVPSAWPSIGKTTTRLRTAVTNKIIFRSGILESIVASDGASVVKTRNVKWDKLSGSVVLSSSTNNFENEIFTYNHLAYREYQGMGAAYQNIGFKFLLNGISRKSASSDKYLFNTFANDSFLQPGDELIVYSAESNFNNPLASAIYLGKDNGLNLLTCDVVLTAGQYKAMIVRSGFRNHLTVSSGKFTRLGASPTDGGIPMTYSVPITIPGN